jgi:hypothetical protein
MKNDNGSHFMAALSFCNVVARESNVRQEIRGPAKWMFATIIVIMFMVMIAGNTAAYSLGGGALVGNRYRVIISTDIGGGDEDDIQSMVHFLLYSDLFDTEGIISSPPGKGRKKDILEVIGKYQEDYPNLKSHSDKYHAPDYLRSIAKQGAINPAPENGYSSPTEGSKWIIHCAKKKDPRPLYVLVWGAITDVAQVLHDEPGIKRKIRVYFIASWNQKHDQNAFRYIDKSHADLWLIHNNSTFRGWYIGGDQKDDMGNKSFVDKHVKDHGALGKYFVPLKNGRIKMGDTPSYAFLLRGIPDDPTKDSWGGRFVTKKDRPHWWEDDPDPALAEGEYPGAKTVNKWRRKYLRDWQKRMDRCKDKAILSSTQK